MTEAELTARLERPECDNRRLTQGGLALLVMLTALATIYATRPIPDVIKARELFNAAAEAFNSRPRRDRDACSNAFDALESVAKIVLNMPAETFGQVLDEVRRRGTLNRRCSAASSKS